MELFLITSTWLTFLLTFWLLLLLLLLEFMLYSSGHKTNLALLSRELFL
jgi:hypothetical protein